MLHGLDRLIDRDTAFVRRVHRVFRNGFCLAQLLKIIAGCGRKLFHACRSLFEGRGLMLGALAQLLIAVQHFVGGGDDAVAVAAHFAHDSRQTLGHTFQRRLKFTHLVF